VHKLGFTDASFLYLERDGAPMNIASVQLFEKPTPDMDMGAFVRRFKRYLAARVQGVEFMTRRLKPTPFELDQPVWVDDDEFNIGRHVFRTRLATPGTERQLAKLVARLHEAPLDRNHPLWEMHVIDGLADGKFALYSKYHHAAVDGVSAQRIMDVLYSDRADHDPEPLPRATPDSPNNARLVFDAMLNLALQPFEQLTRAGDRLRALGRVGERFQQATAGAAAQNAPRTPFNVGVGEYRAIALTSLPLAEMRGVGKRVGASLNDVLLAVCADGLRRYLQRGNALPDSPLIAGIPVSLRQPGDTGFDNKVSLLRASLATDVEDPIERLKTIAQSTREGKELLTDARALLPDDLHVPGMSWLLGNASATARQLGWHNVATPAINVLVSNVPGPRKTKYLLGARMLTHYPISVVTDGNALNVTVQSYDGRIDLGVTACLDAVADVDVLRDDILEGWRTLKRACRPPAAQAAA